ncbi:TetR/AcrR family transcriptional regulator [Cohnella abietis]|uniref:TetR family transcriptional regulator n=1 Tax=Cohnella abietis TaxID=2507935 RepID=A0A3T1D5B3_9BACL|nr:TetR/AcrR family transcriptional regulator [Cohnella abietis]BBI33303.1 TetR family transcriptional regulator [Cohnella abietis]
MSSNPTDIPTDRRVMRTQQLITEAFLSLVQEKQFSEIIVKDITDKANVNRSTFYSHYQDKFDLLDKIILTKLSTLRCLSENTDKSYQPNFEVPDPYLVALFEHLTSNEKFYSIILTRLPDSSLSAKMTEAIRDFFYMQISNSDRGKNLLIPLDILLDSISSSVMGVIKKWLEQQRIYSSHYMALQLTRLSILGTYKALGYTEIEG